MKHFLGELTALAGGHLNIIDYRRFTVARLKNGFLWEQGRKAARVRVQIPAADEPKLLASIPPGFVPNAWEKIKSWRSGN
jgi:hypothetical protein